MSVTYDIYVKERGRWLLACEFGWDEREAALEKAQSLAQRHYVQAVKVIRERYDKVTQRITESSIFDTSGIDISRNKVTEGAAHNVPAGQVARCDHGPLPALAEFDIWTEDGDFDLQNLLASTICAALPPGL